VQLFVYTMLKKFKFRWSLLLIPFAIAANVAIFAAGLIALGAGTGSLDNKDHLPRASGVYEVLVSLHKPLTHGHIR
jgi:hypothetical protein